MLRRFFDREVFSRLELTARPPCVWVVNRMGTKCSTQIVRGIGQSAKMDPQSTSRIGLRAKPAPRLPWTLRLGPSNASERGDVVLKANVTMLSWLENASELGAAFIRIRGFSCPRLICTSLSGSITASFKDNLFVVRCRPCTSFHAVPLFRCHETIRILTNQATEIVAKPGLAWNKRSTVINRQTESRDESCRVLEVRFRNEFYWGVHVTVRNRHDARGATAA